jgi:lipoprotein-releasing system permease protein
LIPLQGGSFLIDYYPVKLNWPDFVLVAVTVLFIALIAFVDTCEKSGQARVFAKSGIDRTRIFVIKRIIGKKEVYF